MKKYVFYSIAVAVVTLQSCSFSDSKTLVAPTQPTASPSKIEYDNWKSKLKQCWISRHQLPTKNGFMYEICQGSNIQNPGYDDMTEAPLPSFTKFKTFGTGPIEVSFQLPGRQEKQEYFMVKLPNTGSTPRAYAEKAFAIWNISTGRNLEEIGATEINVDQFGTLDQQNKRYELHFDYLGE
jgi:hypothetical protein